MTRMRAAVSIAYIPDTDNDNEKILGEVYDLIFEKALIMAKTKRLANKPRVSYINNNAQKEVIL
jgi:hypothetical protein